MEEYKVKKEDLKGEIKDFPIEVVQKMVDCHIKQFGSFEPYSDGALTMTPDGLFDWGETEEGVMFWWNVIIEHNFDLFFERYPKK